MSICTCCNENEGVMDFHVMEVRTTKARDSAGRISRIQELCGLSDLSVCERCIAQKLSEIQSPMKQFLPTFKYTLLLLIISVFLVVRQSERFYTILGAALILGCLYKMIDFFMKASSKKKSFTKFSQNNARFVAAWECISQAVPKHDSNSSISFIPITDATYKMSEADFCSFYGLTHDNAREFYSFLHKQQIENK